MSTPSPVQFSGSLQYPPDEGSPNAEVQVALAAQYTSLANFKLDLSGSGSKVVNLGTIGPLGAKLLLVEVDADASLTAAPVMIQFNSGGTPGQIEVAPGGFIVIGNPKPTTSGILGLTIVYTVSAVVRVHVFG